MKSTRYIPYISIFLIYLFMEGLCYLGLLLLEKAFNTPYDPNISALSEEQRAFLEKFLRHRKGEQTAQDAVLGWVPNSHTNSTGMRDDREYERVPSPGVIRYISSYNALGVKV